MREKIYRFVFIETQFRKKFAIFLAIFIVCSLEIGFLFFIDHKIDEGETRRALILRIPEMERFLYPGANRQTIIGTQTSEPVTIEKEQYRLKGIKQLEGKPSALINNDVYQEGDAIRDYRVTKITTDSVLLKNIKTDELKILRFGY